MNKAAKVYPFDLKLNCRNMTDAEMYELESEIVCSTSSGYIDTQMIGDDTIFVKGEVTDFDYDKIWSILEGYDVIVD